MNILLELPTQFYVMGMLFVFFLVGWLHDGKVNAVDKVFLFTTLYGLGMFAKDWLVSNSGAGGSVIVPLSVLIFATIFLWQILLGRGAGVLVASIVLGWASYSLIPEVLSFIEGGLNRLVIIIVLAGYLLLVMVAGRISAHRQEVLSFEPEDDSDEE